MAILPFTILSWFSCESRPSAWRQPSVPFLTLASLDVMIVLRSQQLISKLLALLAQGHVVVDLAAAGVLELYVEADEFVPGQVTQLGLESFPIASIDMADDVLGASDAKGSYIIQKGLLALVQV